MYVTKNLRVSVISERIHSNGRIICRIKPHPMFRSVDIYRARLIMAEHMGRPLARSEYILYRNGNRQDDRLRNIKIVSPQEHNRHHKTGSKHSNKSRRQISRTVLRRLAAGELKKSGVQGERHGGAKLTEKKVREIRKLRGAGVLYRQISKRYGVTIQSVWAVVTKKTWGHVCT